MKRDQIKGINEKRLNKRDDGKSLNKRDK